MGTSRSRPFTLKLTATLKGYAMVPTTFSVMWSASSRLRPPLLLRTAASSPVRPTIPAMTSILSSTDFL